MDYKSAFEKLTSIGQQQLLRCWNVLTETEQKQLLDQIQHLDIEEFSSLQHHLLFKTVPQKNYLNVFHDVFIKGSQSDQVTGKKLIAQGQVGCLVVAGGQGSRLRFDGPKGMFPVTVIQHKSLFQLLAEKVLAAGKEAQRALPLAIMTSPSNHEETIHFFSAHRYFGLQEEQVTFFSQGELPLLDRQGNLILESPGKIAEGAEGNGTALQRFMENGVWNKWVQQGVRYLNFILIDNPLADPFDAELVGFQHQQQADLVIKCIERFDPDEKVGIIVENNDKIEIVEYSEFPKEELQARDSEGALKHRCANISLFSFTMDFITGVPYDHVPLHQAFKAIKYLDENGVTKMSDTPIACKFEKFIFDLLPFANLVRVLIYPREECFAPLKNASGPDSMMTVQEALQRYDRMIYEKISDRHAPTKPFELSPQFYYPTLELLERWQGKELKEGGYIEA